MPNSLYVAWQDDATRAWHTVGRLTRLKNGYEFIFTRGASVLRTIPHDLFRMNVFHIYRSSELLPLFRNKLPSRSRPDFLKMATWLNLKGNEPEFELLSRFGLIPGTDSILVYPEPTVLSGRYSLEFFVHGIRYMRADAVKWCETVQAGSRLLPLLDVQNPVDTDAVALRPEKENILLGYIPKFYAHDFRKILSDRSCAETARLTVLRCNNEAPPQLRLLLRFESFVPQNFRALDTESHQPLEQAVLRA